MRLYPIIPMGRMAQSARWWARSYMSSPMPRHADGSMPDDRWRPECLVTSADGWSSSRPRSGAAKRSCPEASACRIAVPVRSRTGSRRPNLPPGGRGDAALPRPTVSSRDSPGASRLPKARDARELRPDAIITGQPHDLGVDEALVQSRHHGRYRSRRRRSHYAGVRQARAIFREHAVCRGDEDARRSGSIVVGSLATQTGELDPCGSAERTAIDRPIR
jgi:hypothetical protein